MERAEKFLRDRIADGTYPTHHLLPSMEHLEGQTGIGRTTFNKAARKIAADRLLLIVSGRGVVVTDPDDFPQGDTIEVHLRTGERATWPIGNRTQETGGRTP
ncbi:GntR family transcriptional regulator [Streptomyces sp. NPDC004539]|uniref:GntR family transcriptional regulator n=1 Tax=Streptomyces sp. NPDC004539 TaxID=3154280 RepID=UPI0033B0EEFC